jgi:hypothetical protein
MGMCRKLPWCGGFDTRFSIPARPHSECQIQNRTGNNICWYPFGPDIRNGIRGNMIETMLPELNIPARQFHAKAEPVHA